MRWPGDRAALGICAKLHPDRYTTQGNRMNKVLPGFMDSYEIDDEARRSTLRFVHDDGYWWGGWRGKDDRCARRERPDAWGADPVRAF